MTKFLKYLPSPLLDDIISDRSIPVIGSGFSKNAVLPNDLSMPTWSELGERLAERMTIPYSGNPLEIVSEFQEEFNRPKLVEALEEELYIDEAKPGHAHVAFAGLPFDEIITTNFDFLLEHAYDEIPRRYYPITDESQLPIGKAFSDDLSKRKTKILKIHGDLNHATRLVATEDDYDLFPHNYPLTSTYVANLLMVRTPILIGYSLDDPDFRGIWQLVGSRLGKMRRMAYALTIGTRASEVKRFERRGVKVISIGDDKKLYSEAFTELFRELRKYWFDNLARLSTPPNEETLLEIEKPSDSSTRLCYFSLPSTLVPYYRSNIFPVFKEHGYVPISPSDVVPQGGNFISSITSLIERAGLIIFDVSKGFQMADEAKFAKSRTGKILVLIVEQGTNIQIEEQPSRTFHIIHRKNELDQEATADLVRLIGRLLRELSGDFVTRLFEEPRRLFQKGEYRASVISSITLLETALREKLGLKSPVPLRQVFNTAQKKELIGQEMNKLINKWIPIRNQAVHTIREVQKHEAEEIVQGTYFILNKIKP